MTKHVLLDNVTHKDLRIRAGYREGTGYDVNVARVFPAEFELAQRDYPLFFIKNKESGHFETIAMLGFVEGENLYLTKDGWSARYIPWTIQRQPFLIGFQEQTTEGVPTRVPVVHVDMDHPAVNTSEGERVFLPQGGESPYLERVSAILQAIHHGHEASEAFSKLLVGLELIESVSVDVEFRDGTKHSLAGLYSINEDKLASLSANGFEVLNRKGHLKDVFMLLASLVNMPELIDRKNERMTA